MGKPSHPYVLLRLAHLHLVLNAELELDLLPPLEVVDAHLPVLEYGHRREDPARLLRVLPRVQHLDPQLHLGEVPHRLGPRLG